MIRHIKVVCVFGESKNQVFTETRLIIIELLLLLFFFLKKKIYAKVRSAP